MKEAGPAKDAKEEKPGRMMYRPKAPAAPAEAAENKATPAAQADEEKPVE